MNQRKKRRFNSKVQIYANANTLQALMQQHATLCDQQETIVNTALTAGRAMSAEETTSFTNLQTSIDGMAATIARATNMQNRSRELDQPEAPPLRPSNLGGLPVQGEILDDAGFGNFGEFLNGVKFGDKKGRLNNLSTSDVGIQIPPQFSQNILRLAPEQEIIMPRANNIPAGDPPDSEFTIPYFSQGANGANGGMELTWTAEAATVADLDKPVLKDLTLKPQEVSGLATINNKTLTNWQASGQFLQGVMQQAWVSGRDYKFFRGNGVGCPLGIYNADGAIKVVRDTSLTIKLPDIANMMGRLLPASLMTAVWVASITALPTLIQLNDSAGRTIFIQGDVTKGIAASLFGIPLLWTGKAKTIGNEGDLMLVDFTYYLTKAGSGPFIAISEHVKFTTNQTVFKIVANIDGQPWVKDPLKLEDGETTVSPYVILK